MTKELKAVGYIKAPLNNQLNSFAESTDSSRSKVISDALKFYFEAFDSDKSELQRKSSHSRENRIITAQEIQAEVKLSRSKEND